MTTRTPALFDPTALGPSLEIVQGGEVLAVTADSLSTARTARATIGQAGALWNFEMMTWSPEGSLQAIVGVATADASLSVALGNDAEGLGFVLSSGAIRNNNATLTTVSAAALGDIIGVGVNFAASTVTFYVNGSAVATVSIPGTMAGTLYPAASLGSGTEGDNQLFLNSGQRSFEYPLPDSDGWYQIPVTPDAIRFSEGVSFFSKGTDTIPNQEWVGCIGAVSLTTVRGLNFWPWGRDSSRGAAAQVIINDPDGEFDVLLEGNVRDLEVAIEQVENLIAEYSTAERIGTFVLDRVEAINDGQKRLTLRDASAVLDKPLQSRLFLPNAPDDIANRPVPICIGACRSVEPVFISETTGLNYQVSDSACAFGQLRDKGDLLLIPGDYTVNVGAQSINLVSAPVGKLTVDVSSVGGGDGTTPPSPNLTSDDIADYDTVVSVTQTSPGDPFLFQGSGVVPGQVFSYIELAGVLTAGVTYRLSFAITMAAAVSSDGVPRRFSVGQGVSGSALQNVVYSVTETGAYTTSFVAPTTGPLTFAFRGVPGASGNSATVSGLICFEIQELSELEVEPIGFEDFAREILTRRGGLREDQWSAADAAAIDNATGYGIGLHASEPISLSAALQAALVGYTACFWQGSDGVIRFSRLIDPASQTSSGTITSDEMLADLIISTDDAPGLTAQMAGQRNWSVLSPTDFVTDYVDVPIELRKILGRRFRQVRTTGVPFPSEYTHARGAAEPVETLLDSPEDLQTEIDRVAQLYQTPRKFYQVTVPIEALGEYELGETWTLEYPRYGLQAGKDCLIVRITEDRIARTATLRLWG